MLPKHLGQGDGRCRKQTAGDQPRELYVTPYVRLVDSQEHRDARGFARRHLGRVSICLQSRGPFRGCARHMTNIQRSSDVCKGARVSSVNRQSHPSCTIPGVERTGVGSQKATSRLAL